MANLETFGGRGTGSAPNTKRRGESLRMWLVKLPFGKKMPQGPRRR